MKFALQGQPNVFLSPPPEIILLANLRVAPFQGAFPRVLMPRPKGLGYRSVTASRSGPPHSVDVPWQAGISDHFRNSL